ncbi:MAG: transcription antitermination factor NusB [Planctomycetota bacterium]
MLCELHRSRRTTRQVWDGPRAGAETALVLGALRRRGTLDAILQAHSTRKLALVKPETLASLRVALFELLFFDESPSHAVIHAAVENVKRFGRFKDLGFTNAVLRGIVRGRRRVAAAEATDPRRSLPRDGHTVLFRRVVFPDPQAKPAEFLAARGSTAPWIARRRLGELGFERALYCLDLQAATPPTFVRPAPERLHAVKDALAAAGIAWQAGPHEALLELPSGVRAGDVIEACGAWLVFQDAVASRVAPFLGPPPGARVLDYCAAPGGKATHLAQLVGSEGHVTAWDADPGRLAKVAENAERLGLKQLRCEAPAGPYDAALADVPCSNTGVLARRPEARWRIKERHLPGLAERQLRILRDAAAHLRPGGSLVYSTCSLEAEENRGVVDLFLAGHAGFDLEETHTAYPDEGAGDGGFMARMRLGGV